MSAGSDWDVGKLLIGGHWQDGAGPRFTAEDPANGALVWEGAAANSDQISAAVRAARAAFSGWARTPLAARIAHLQAYGEILKVRAPSLAHAISAEMGKPAWEAAGEVQTMIGKIAVSIKAQAERAGQRQEATGFGQFGLDHRPHGVAVVLGPFNFPGHLPNGHIVPALLAGNTVVFKPSELTPGVGALLVAALVEAGLPAGVINLVQGGGAVGAQLIAEPGVDAVLFTGSHTVGSAIHRHFAGRPEVVLALEMGGNNPLIVHDGVDPAIAANLIVHSAYLTTGQRCSCARRLIVPEGAFGAAVVEALVALARGLVIGPADHDPAPFMGPLVRPAAAAKAHAFFADLVARGGQPLLTPTGEGAFVSAGLIDTTGVAQDDTELFGPVLQVVRVKDLDAAIATANATQYGLAAGLIGGDAGTWARVQAEVRAGVLNWNRPTTGASGALPFGGPGWSGSARPSAYYAADYCAYPVAQAISADPVAIPALGLPTVAAGAA